MANATPQLKPIAPQYRHNALSDQQLDDIQTATLEILSEVGFYCPSEKALRFMQNTVDRSILMSSWSNCPAPW